MKKKIVRFLFAVLVVACFSELVILTNIFVQNKEVNPNNTTNEVELTDVNLKNDISSKISMILSDGFESSISNNYFAWNFHMNDLNFTDSEKLRIVLNSTSSKRRLMTLDDSEKMDAVIASYYGEDYKTNPRYVGDNFSPIGSDYVIDGETILSSYKDLFNEEVKDYNLTLDNCPVFKYDANANMYLILRGCGNGPDVPVTLFSKDKYVVDGDKVIVYVGIANYTKTYDSKTYEVVKTAIYKGIDDSGAIIKNVNINLGDDEAIIDAINEYKNEFEKYKFVFEKNSEGTYSFKELSKA